jgi:nicotinate-nucleotide adenylyltransferase
VFGGTFDPPHMGHRTAVNGLFTEPGVRAIRVVPSPQPPHKPPLVSAEHRVEMARLNFLTTPQPSLRGPVKIDLCEIRRATARPGTPSYSFDTLGELKRDVSQLAFTIGTDQLARLPSWHRFPEILGLCHWIVLKRKGASNKVNDGLQTLAQFEASGLLQTQNGSYRVRATGTTLQVFETSAPELSSTEIRESLARSGNPPTGSILPEVHNYLMKHRLYGSRAK